MALNIAIQINKESNILGLNDSNINKDCKFIFDEKNRGYISYTYDDYLHTLHNTKDKREIKKIYYKYDIHIPVLRNFIIPGIFINFAVTKKEHQNKGIFKHLFFELVKKYKNEKKIIYLETNLNLLKLFHKLGFKLMYMYPPHGSRFLLSFDWHLIYFNETDEEEQNNFLENIILNGYAFDENLYKKSINKVSYI